MPDFVAADKTGWEKCRGSLPMEGGGTEAVVWDYWTQCASVREVGRGEMGFSTEDVVVAAVVVVVGRTGGDHCGRGEERRSRGYS